MSRHAVHVVVTDQFAGVERHVATVGNGLFRRGWTVTVVGGEVALMRAALDPGVEHHGVTGIGSTLRRLSHCRRVDILHAHLTAGELSATVAAPLLRAPVLATRHIAALRGSSRAGRIAATIIRRALAVQLAPSHFLADQIGEDCRVLPSGVPDRPRSGRPRERWILVLQRLEPEKATGLAVSAFAASGLANCGWRLVIAGRGSAQGALRDQSREDGVQAAVDFVGFIPDTSDLLNRASMLFAPTPAEAFGLSVAEAMAAGLPVIAAGSGAHPELLGPGGWTFPPGDAGRAGGLLRLLAESPALASAYGDELWTRQRGLFNLDGYLDGLEEIYGEVLSRR